MRLRPVLLGAAVLAAACAPNPYFPAHDYDRDHMADRAWIDHATGTWYTGSPESPTVLFAGQPGDYAVPADYDGDGHTDIVVIRQDRWWVRADGTTLFDFPAPPTGPVAMYRPAEPVPADWDGDGRAEPAWYRNVDATWFVADRDPTPFGRGPTVTPTTHGGASQSDQDFPVPADYDGDRLADLATYSPRTGAWSVRSSRDGSVDVRTVLPVQGTNPMPVAADFDGDGRAERAVVDRNGWHIEGHDAPIVYGTLPHAPAWNVIELPASGDYNGDHRLDLAHEEIVATSDGPAASWQFRSGGSIGFPATRGTPPWPVETPANLIYNVARFELVARCVVDPLPC